jgi:hypothetical protein
MAAHVINPRQLMRGMRSNPELNAASERAVQGSATFVSDPGTTPHGGDWDTHHDLLGPSYMRAAKLANLPSYDNPTGEDPEGPWGMREGKREAIRANPDTAADLEARGIRDPIKVGIHDPVGYLGAHGHPQADAPMAVMNGNHRVTWALDNHPSMWVPIRPITRKKAESYSDPQGSIIAHGKGPNFQGGW